MHAHCALTAKNKRKIEYVKEKTKTFELFIDTGKFICDSQETFPTGKVFLWVGAPPPPLR